MSAPARRRATVTVAIAVAAGLIAAPDFARGQAGPNVKAAHPMVSENAIDTVVATVDGSKIYFGDVLLSIEELPPQYRSLPLQALFDPLLQRLIDRRLASNAARKSGAAEDENVKRRLTMAEDEILKNAFLASVIQPMLTEDNLRKYFAEKQASDESAEVHARHILLKSEARALEVYEEVKRGLDFVEAAKKYSTGPTGPNGGDLGFFTKDRMVPEFARVAFGLEVGQVSSPVQTQFGWHLILVIDRREAKGPDFAQQRETLEREYAQKLASEQAEKLRGEAKIEIIPLSAPGQPGTAAPKKE